MARGPLHWTSMKKQSSELHGSPTFNIDEETELSVTWVHYVQYRWRNRAPSCIIQPCANFCLTILLCTKCVYNTNISDVQLYLHRSCTLVSLYTLPWFCKQLYMYINIPVKRDNVHWLICEDWDMYVTQYPHCSKDCWFVRTEICIWHSTHTVQKTVAMSWSQQSLGNQSLHQEWRSL